MMIRISRVLKMTPHRIDTCNFAVMPYTNPATGLVNPLGISSWGVIKSSGNLLIRDCLEQKSAGGEVFMKSSTHPPACHCSPEVAALQSIVYVER